MLLRFRPMRTCLNCIIFGKTEANEKQDFLQRCRPRCCGQLVRRDSPVGQRSRFFGTAQGTNGKTFCEIACFHGLLHNTEACFDSDSHSVDRACRAAFGQGDTRTALPLFLTDVRRRKNGTVRFGRSETTCA